MVDKRHGDTYPNFISITFVRPTGEGDHSTLLPANTTEADIADEAGRLLQGMNFQPAMGWESGER